MSLAYTAIADIINPEVLADQIAAKFPDMLVLGNTNLVEVDTTFPLGSPGTEFKMPFWKRIGEFGAMTEGTALTPGKISAAAEYATVQRAGIALEVYDTAALVSKSDPISEIAVQIVKRGAQYVDAALVTAAEKTPNTFDQTGASKTNNNMTMDQNAIIVALTKTLGDNYMKMLQGGAIVMHSKVYGDLLQLGVIQNQYQFGGNVLATGVIPTLLGLPIIVSDRTTVSTVSTVNYYNTLIVGPGSLALFHQRNFKVEFDRDTLLQADYVVSTVHFATHLFGWDDKTNAQAAEDAKSIQVVAIKSK